MSGLPDCMLTLPCMLHIDIDIAMFHTCTDIVILHTDIVKLHTDIVMLHTDIATLHTGIAKLHTDIAMLHTGIERQQFVNINFDTHYTP